MSTCSGLGVAPSLKYMIRIMHPFDPVEFLRCTMSGFLLSAAEAGNRTEKEVTVTPGAQVLKQMGNMTQDDLVHQFNEHVRKKSYLIVLNDLSTFEEWAWIKSNFSNNGKRCRIVVSTEQREVAKLCLLGDTAPVLQLKLKQSSADKDIIIYAFCNKGYTDEPLFMSQDEAIKQIIHDTGDQQLKVISICGMGGVGTTLAEGVYRNQEFCAKFNKHAFVKVPSDAEGLISLITNKVMMTDVQDDEDIEQVDPTSLASVLEGKKYLIVLDGLCTIAHWEAIWQELPKGTTTASRIIVTTGILDIANHCSEEGKGYILEHEKLSEGNAWKLFTKKGSQGSRSDDTTTTGSNNTMGGQGNAYSEPLFQGRDEDAKEVVKLISATGDEKFKVIAIYGMGGVGKTSLAKHVYQYHAAFDKRAFVTVNNHPFNANDLIYQLTVELKKDDVPEEKGKDVIVTTKLNGLVKVHQAL